MLATTTVTQPANQLAIRDSDHVISPSDATAPARADKPQPVYHLANAWYEDSNGNLVPVDLAIQDTPPPLSITPTPAGRETLGTAGIILVTTLPAGVLIALSFGLTPQNPWHLGLLAGLMGSISAVVLYIRRERQQ